MIKSKKKKTYKHSQKYNLACHPVEKIIGFYSGKEKKRYYRVQWAPSWVSEENLVGCEKLIEQFFVEENIINKNKKDLNADIINKMKIKLEEEDYDCWGCESKPTVKEPINNVDDNVNSGTHDVVEPEKKINESTPTKCKAVTRAMMSTTSPNSVNTLPQPSVNKKSINVKHEDSSGEESTAKRKYHTRQYYREMHATLRHLKRKNIVPKNTGNNVCKVYNTRQRLKEVSTNKDCKGKGAKYVAGCVQKLTFGDCNSISRSRYPRHCHIKEEEGTLVANACDSSTVPFNNVNNKSIKNETIDISSTELSKETMVMDGKEHSNRVVSNMHVRTEVQDQTRVKQDPDSSNQFPDQFLDYLPDYLRYPHPSVQTSNYTTIKKMVIKQEEELRKYKYCNTFLVGNNVKEETRLVTETIPKLENYLVRDNDKSKSRINLSDTSSDENEVTAVLPFECDVCEKMFHTSVLLHRHRFIHCENKPFSFNKRKGNVQKEDKENYDFGKLRERDRGHNASASTEYSHHLRPRKDVKNLR